MKVYINLVGVFCLSFLMLLSCKEKEKQYSPLIEPTAVLYDSTLKPFYHGVASGDPLRDRVIIWTRVTPQDSVPSIDVQWQVSTDAGFSSIFLPIQLQQLPNMITQ